MVVLPGPDFSYAGGFVGGTVFIPFDSFKGEKIHRRPEGPERVLLGRTPPQKGGERRALGERIGTFWCGRAVITGSIYQHRLKNPDQPIGTLVPGHLTSLGSGVLCGDAGGI